VIRFVPHLLLLALGFLWSRELALWFSDIAFILIAAALPVWALFVPPPRSLWRAFWLGPGVAIALALAVWLPWDPGGDLGGLIKFLVLAAIGIYFLYCGIVFAIAAWSRRRRW
jgi:hypothetical protein